MLRLSQEACKVLPCDFLYIYIKETLVLIYEERTAGRR